MISYSGVLLYVVRGTLASTPTVFDEKIIKNEKVAARYTKGVFFLLGRKSSYAR